MSDLYGVAKNVIASKRYDLKDMLSKLDRLWMQNEINEEQYTELVSLAQNNAQVENGIDILNKLYELDRRITALEKAKEPTDEETTVETTYPEYVTGAWYYTGDKVSFDGSNYVCVAPEGTVCVWSPAEYPAYWELFAEDSLLTE